MTFVDVIRNFLQVLFSFDGAHPLLFTQFYFWAFFGLVFAVFSFFHSKPLLRNAYLFFVSLFFYYKTSGIFLLLLLFVVTYNFFASRWIQRGRPGWKTFWLVLSVIVDLGVLAYFKYAYFLADFLNDLFGLSIQVRDVLGELGNMLTGTSVFRVDAIILPVGISFFTFQAISYVVDVWRGKVGPLRNFLEFGFFLTFFPQLVAGPIVRAPEFFPQLHRPYNLSRRWFGIAVFWIMNGLVKKLVLADYLAVSLSDRVFENPLLYTGFENLAALFCYSLQVYADFSGYTDIATGVALLMGFYLPKNFDSPYKAENTQQFWRRWHMSLSRWLKDYLYIPLGGNRKATWGSYIIIFAIAVIGSFLSGSWWVAITLATLTLLLVLYGWRHPSKRRMLRTHVNAMDTMLLGGLWHGASWNFMIWGGLNGIGQIIYKVWTKWSIYGQSAFICGLWVLLHELAERTPAPVWNLFYVWVSILAFGTLVRLGYHITCGGSKADRGNSMMDWISNAWAVFQTFVFITFTRLFFRSGSNLDPAMANETAWRTAKNMVNQIGSPWDLGLLPTIVHQHRTVLLVFLAGMLVHWLPDRWKRRYRITFAKLPLPVMALVVFAIIFVVYQFITADLQSFIYFQF